MKGGKLHGGEVRYVEGRPVTWRRGQFHEGEASDKEGRLVT